MKLIIAGGRKYVLTAEDYDKLDAIHAQYPVTEEVSGEATGADTYGKRWAEALGIPVKKYPADWTRFGLVAGYIRNTEMAQYADALAVFPGGNGTNHMWREAKRCGLKIFDYRTTPIIVHGNLAEFIDTAENQ